jgi:ribosomal protein S27AE
VNRVDSGRGWWWRALGGLRAPAALMLLTGPGALAAQEPLPFEDSPFLRLDPEKVVLDRSDSRVPCGECHTLEYEAWRLTAHATGFDELHRSAGAQDILAAMGLRTAKRQESLCLRCHYTVAAPRLDAIAGVSCESCHGAAADWLDVHNDWGGVQHPDQEAADHRALRVEQSIAGGMMRPSGDLYAVAANCFECHTVPVEELVNVGGHRAGSRFELVEWASQVRHNYLEAQWSENRANREPSDDRKHMMYVTGRILDYEYSLRGLARATIEDRYASAMARRVAEARVQLETIVRAVEIPEVLEILGIGRDAPLGVGNGSALLAVAGRIREIGQAFSTSNDGSGLAAVAPLLAGGTAVVVEADPAPAAGVDEALEPAGTPASAPPPTGTGSAEPAPAAAAPVIGAAAAPSVPVLPGEVRRRPAWFPPADPAHRTLADPFDCGSCHERADIWWAGDPHSKTSIRLRNREPRAVEIATLYGVAAADMARGNQICMSCHGTVASLTPTAEVQLGVSCESCHGPASEYLDPHQEGENTGLGLVNLKTADGRSGNCLRCHRISDERLLAAGHPSGADYDIAAADASIRHWPDDGRRVVRERERRGAPAYVELASAELVAAAERLARGRPIPAVQVASLPTPPPTPGRAPPPPPPAATTSAPAATAAPPAARAAGTSPTVTTAGPAAAPTASAGLPAEAARRDLGAAPATALPAAPDTLSTEELLLYVKRRLEELGRSGPPGPGGDRE